MLARKPYAFGRQPALDSGAKTTILILDNEVERLRQLSGLVASAGYTCCCCRDAETAIAAARDTTPDLILAEINLAGHNGVAICQQLKCELGLIDVPLMFLSSAQTPDIIRRSYDAGGAYSVRTPYDPAVLLDLIDKALSATLAAHAS